MKNYIEYLEKKGYSKKSIPTYLSPTTRFITWAKDYGTTPQTIDYKGFLVFLEGFKKQGFKSSTLNIYVIAIKIYFDYLIDKEQIEVNPIQGLVIKKRTKTVLKNVLEWEELESLFYCYEAENDFFRKRNKIMLGLMIYQGLNTSEIYGLKLENIHLSKGTIEIIGTRRTNGRSLKIDPCQFMGIVEYSNEIRPAIIDNNNIDTTQYFLSKKGKTTLLNSLEWINKELKIYNAKYKSFKQIRASVIVNWLKTHNLRKVQYMAGHRYISSTERYLQTDLKGLQDMIDSFHPIK